MWPSAAATPRSIGMFSSLPTLAVLVYPLTLAVLVDVVGDSERAAGQESQYGQNCHQTDNAKNIHDRPPWELRIGFVSCRKLCEQRICQIMETRNGEGTITICCLIPLQPLVPQSLIHTISGKIFSPKRTISTLCLHYISKWEYCQELLTEFE